MTAPARPAEPRGDTPRHKRLSDFESFDKITFEVVPRYKESELSGDEWRQHVQINFYHKGHLVHSAGYGDMRSALMFAPSEWANAQSPIPNKVLEIERTACDQPGCTNQPVVRAILKKEFSRNGEALDMADVYGSKYRLFCSKHQHRGNCSREDSDDNYTKEPL